jgi:hypothetical protein
VSSIEGKCFYLATIGTAKICASREEGNCILGKTRKMNGLEAKAEHLGKTRTGEKGQYPDFKS